MKRRRLLRALPLLALAPPTPANAETPPPHRVLVTTNGWHSGIVLARADLPPEILPERADFPDAAFIEFGWGDAEYYPAPRPSLGMAFAAAFPGPALMHVSGLPSHPAQVFPTVAVLTLPLRPEQMQPLVAAIAASFARAGAARAQPTASPGLYAFSRFYPATGRFHAFNTCNTWTARILASAGLAISPDGVQSADDLLARLRPLTQAD